MPGSASCANALQLFSSGWRIAADRLRQVAAREAGSPDLHQAKMRFLVLAGSVAYMVSIGAIEHRVTETQALIFGLSAVLYGLFALNMHAHFKRSPSPNYSRRGIGLFADHAAALVCLAVTGRDAGALAWLHLFIIQGVGIRFGVRWLIASQVIGLASMTVVWAVNPFFRENTNVGVGAILSLLVLPLYFALLAIREARVKTALEAARLSAEAANEAKGRFVAMISHELRSPLTGIAGLNELLRKQGLPAQAQQLLIEQHAATSLMLRMVNDILDLSKVQDGQMHLEEVDFDPQELALRVVDAFSFQAEQKGLLVRTELDASLPIAVNGSPFHVTRILQNLLSNAIKFTSEGSIALRVRRGDSPSIAGELTVEFEVTDTGMGIPKEALSRIFDRFYQVDAAITRRFGGTGLGTSLVKEFCDLLKGHVRLESQLGEGTTCRVELPFRTVRSSNPEDVRSIAGAAVMAWTDGMADWPRIKAELLAAGASVLELNDGQQAAPRLVPTSAPAAHPPVLLLGGTPSELTLAGVAAFGLADPFYILLEDAELGLLSPASASRVAIRARSDAASIARALRLAALGCPSDQTEAIGQRNKLQQSPAGEQVSRRVLIAEDTPAIQLVMHITLESAGFAVTVANDGAEALSKAMWAPYDVVVLDWHMPQLDGIEVLRRIRTDAGPNARTPVIIATAAPSRQLIDTATAAGAAAVLSKPFAGEDLVRAVAEAADNIAKTATTKIVTAEHSRDNADSSRKVTLVLDIDALEAPGSVFRSGNPAEFVSVFARDVKEKAELFKQAVQAGDLALFRSGVHSLTGYAGAYGARRLQWLLSIAPRHQAELIAHGPAVLAELCDTMNATALALEEWSADFCSTQ